MLISLHIENIAVIKCVDFDFTPGFMVLTGETGAGKSIVIDSINLLLGAKAERELIRSGCATATVSGLFGDFSPSISKRLADVGVDADDDGCVCIQRTISQDGRSRITVNGRAVSLAVLKSVTPLLVSIHGQSDTSSLFDSKNHLELLDTYADNREIREKYAEVYARLESIRREIEDITEKANESERMKEILLFQIR